MIKKIISGGQTGVDRAALDAAIQSHIPHGGWCPKGRLAELGETIPEIYNLIETDSAEYSVRTKLNIQDSDGTLILVPSFPIKVSDGTLLTLEEVKNKNKPYLVIDISAEIDLSTISNWAKENNITILNIAGPRESQSSGIYEKSLFILEKIFSFLQFGCMPTTVPRL